MAAYVRYMSLHLVRSFTNLVQWLVMSTWRLSFRRLRAIHVMFDDTPLNQGISVSFLLIFFQIFHYVSGHFGGVQSGIPPRISLICLVSRVNDASLYV